MMKNLWLSLLCCLPLISCSQSKEKKLGEPSPRVEVAQPVNAFTTMKFELDGKPCIAVINTQYKDFQNKSKFPLSLFLTVKTVDQDKNGHPTEKEAAAFHALQSKIIKSLSDAFLFCHAGTTTMPGTRDILLYISAKDQGRATEVLNKIKLENERLQAYTFESDPEWEAVASFYEAVDVKN